MKFKFLKSPTGVYGLGYNEGDIVDSKNFKQEMVADMLKNKFIEPVKAGTADPEGADSNPAGTAEKATGKGQAKK